MYVLEGQPTGSILHVSSCHNNSTLAQTTLIATPSPTMTAKQAQTGTGDVSCLTTDPEPCELESNAITLPLQIYIRFTGEQSQIGAAVVSHLVTDPEPCT